MNKLTELPNIGATLADKLEAIGVTSRDDLVKLGSVQALIRIGAATGSGCFSMLYALEGAIQGIRWHSLPQQVRQELKRQLEDSRAR